MTACITVEGYGHPGSHPPAIITQDVDNRFITDAQLAEIAASTIHDALVIGNPHSVTQTEVGLGNCDNTSDVNKPVSTAQAVAIALKTDQTEFDAHFHYLLRNGLNTITGLTVDSAGDIILRNGVSINEFSTDGTFVGDSDDAVPTERAAKQYVDDSIIAANLVSDAYTDDAIIAENLISDAYTDAALVSANTYTDNKFTSGLTQSLTFGGGAIGDVATMQVTNGLVTAVTLVV